MTSTQEVTGPMKQHVEGGTVEKKKPLRSAKQSFVVNAYSLEHLYVRLQDAGIDTEKTAQFEDNTVFVFTKTELKSLLFKARLFISKRFPSRTKNVEWIWLAPVIQIPEKVLEYVDAQDHAAHAAVRIVDEFNGMEKLCFALIASNLYKAIKRSIIISVPHGKETEYNPDGPFQIYFWSTPKNISRGIDTKVRTPHLVFKLPIQCTDPSFSPEKNPLVINGIEHEGIIIYDDDYAVAELFPNALYVHHDLVHRGLDSEFKIFAELLNRCIMLLMEPQALAKYKAEIKKYELEAEKRRIEAEKEAFTNLVEASVSKRATRQEAAVKTAEKIAASKKQEYFEAERTLFAERQALLDPTIAKARFLAEYEKLRAGQIDGVSGVTFDPSKPLWIVVHTDDIEIEHPITRNIHLIGKCDISFNLEKGGLTIINRDRVYTLRGFTFYTPHVFKEGCTNVCLGNIESELLSYIAHYEIEAATALTLAFLQSVKEHDGYLERLECFPLAKKARKAA